MRKLIDICIFTCLIMMSLQVNSQEIIITAKDFAGELKNNKSIVIIDANSPDNYAKQHIQGAINIWHQDLYLKGPVEGLLKSPDELAAFFGKKGLTITTPLIIYDDGSQKYNSNLFVILKYLGATNMRLLHRDPATFEQSRIPMSATAASLKPAVFVPNVADKFFHSMQDVITGHGNTQFLLVDVREKDEFLGKVEKSKGHLPGAIHVNYKDVLTDKGAFKSKEELEKIFAAAGISAEKTICLYCYTGVKAAVTYVALTSILGYPDCRVYEGSYNEWVSQPVNPIEQ